jgi:hypothetical protein
MSRLKKLYVHCGFHKTGSTALQAALRASEAPLRQAGFLYPYAGSGDNPGAPGDNPHQHGQHNLGFEIDRHWLFQPRFGTIAGLTKEIGGYPGHVILSSESFESVIENPDQFAALQALAQQTGRRLTLVVYLRNQLAYCESLYRELLRHEARKEYARHAGEILETGMLRFRESLYHFDYERTLGKWTAHPGIDVLARNYHALAGNSIVTDFAQVIGAEGILQSRAKQEIVNTHDSCCLCLEQFYGNRTRRELSRIERRRIDYLTRNNPHPVSSPSLQQAFIRRFQESNQRACATWGLPTAGLTMTDLSASAAEMTLEQMFSFESRSVIASGIVPDSGQDTAWMQGIEMVDDRMSFPETLRYCIGQAGKYWRWYASRLRSIISPLALDSLIHYRH